MHLKHLFFLCFNFSQKHICITHLNALLWSLPSASYPTIKILSTMSNTLGWSLNILFIFHWNMSPTAASKYGSLVSPYLPNWHAKRVTCYDFVVHFRLWYPKLASISFRYCIFVSYGNISLIVVSLCIGLISNGLSLSGSKHGQKIPFNLGTITKLLHHSAVLSACIGMITCCSGRCSNYFKWLLQCIY